ncbi:hypothetical protein Efla_002342 [Eimeria flavescens]
MAKKLRGPGDPQHGGAPKARRGPDAAGSHNHEEAGTSSSSKKLRQRAAAAAEQKGPQTEDIDISDGCLDEEETLDAHGDTAEEQPQQQQQHQQQQQQQQGEEQEKGSSNVLLNTSVTGRQQGSALDRMGYVHPSHVQAAAIPAALRGQDLLGLGFRVWGFVSSGSGKTAAFLLPLLERLLQIVACVTSQMTPQGPVGGLRGSKGLVLLPTRELALQCFDLLQRLCLFAPLTSTLAVGGAPLPQQEAALRQQPDVLVGTPGRILDLLLNSASTHLELLEVVILDEADRLLELGFRDEILQVLRHCHRGRQTLLFSATLTPSISSLALLALEAPLHISCKPHGITSSSSSSSSSSKKQQQQHVAENLEQQFVELQGEEQRMPALIRLVRTSFNKRVIVFFGTKKAAHEAFLIFSLLKLPAAELHGDLTQQMRFEALQKFQSGEAEFLLASELASRGLDVTEVRAVINFAPPKDADRYVHSVGRTARMGRQGIAATLYNRNSQEKHAVKRLLAILGARGPQQQQQQQQKVLRRRTDAEQLKAIKKELEGLEPALQKRRQEERLEREMRLAQLFVKKADNMQQHADEIYSRPQREWFVSGKDKRNIQEASRLDAEAKALITSSSSSSSSSSGKASGAAAAKQKQQQQEETTESGSSEEDTSESEAGEDTGSEEELPDWVTAAEGGDSDEEEETEEPLDEGPVTVKQLRISKEQKAKLQQQRQQQQQGKKGKKQPPLSRKQTERLEEFRVAKAAARSVKRKARPQRMRLGGVADDEDAVSRHPQRKKQQQRRKRKQHEMSLSSSSSSSKAEAAARPLAKKQRRAAAAAGRSSFKSKKRYKRR